MNNLIKKGVAVAVILLFVSVSVIPSTGYIVEKKPTTSTNYDGSLSGYVNNISMNPIEGARVRVYFHETYEENYTDSSGYYNVDNIPICYCLKKCTASKEGYKTEQVLLGIVENTTYDFVLAPRNKAFNMNLLFLRFLEQHPHLFPILRHMLGL